MSTSLPTSTPPSATNAFAQLPDPRTSQPVLLAGTLSLVPETSLSMATGASPSAMGVMSNAELTAAVLDLGKMVVGIHAFLLGPQGPQLSTSPSLIPSFTTPNPVPPQQDSDGVFYGGVDDIQASAAQLQAVAYCLLARRQGRQHPIFKRWRPVVPTAVAL